MLGSKILTLGPKSGVAAKAVPQTASAAATTATAPARRCDARTVTRVSSWEAMRGSSLWSWQKRVPRVGRRVQPRRRVSRRPPLVRGQFDQPPARVSIARLLERADPEREREPDRRHEPDEL